MTRVQTIYVLCHLSYTVVMRVHDGVHTIDINPLKGRDVNWLHFAIQV